MGIAEVVAGEVRHSEKRPILCVTEKKPKTSIPILVWGLPESVWVGICQYSKSGSPHSAMGFIPIWGPTYTYEFLQKYLLDPKELLLDDALVYLHRNPVHNKVLNLIWNLTESSLKEKIRDQSVSTYVLYSIVCLYSH